MTAPTPKPAEPVNIHDPSAFRAALGKVINVADGDTITLLAAGNVQVKIRLLAIDTPEGGQEYDERSRQALAALVAGKQVEAEVKGTDKYGRDPAWTKADGVEVNRPMIADGWA